MEAMSATIWKYEWPHHSLHAQFEMPLGAKIIHVGQQYDKLVLWAHVDPYAPKERRMFAACYTGGAAPENDDGRFLGTVLLAQGEFVLHVFEPINKGTLP